jgi:hypothetical protein
MLGLTACDDPSETHGSWRGGAMRSFFGSTGCPDAYRAFEAVLTESDLPTGLIESSDHGVRVFLGVNPSEHPAQIGAQETAYQDGKWRLWRSHALNGSDYDYILVTGDGSDSVYYGQVDESDLSNCAGISSAAHD